MLSFTLSVKQIACEFVLIDLMFHRIFGACIPRKKCSSYNLRNMDILTLVRWSIIFLRTRLLAHLWPDSRLNYRNSTVSSKECADTESNYTSKKNNVLEIITTVELYLVLNIYVWEYSSIECACLNKIKEPSKHKFWLQCGWYQCLWLHFYSCKQLLCNLQF